jgi:hypothetical protein
MDNRTGILFSNLIKRDVNFEHPIEEYSEGGRIVPLIEMIEEAIDKLSITKKELHDLVMNDLTRSGELSYTDADHVAQQYREAGQDAQIRFLIEDREPYFGYVRTLVQLMIVAEKR